MKTENSLLNTCTENMLSVQKDGTTSQTTTPAIKNCHKVKSFKSVDMWQIQKRHFKTELRKPLML